MTQDNKPRDYHFGTDIPIPTMDEVYDAQNEDDDEQGPIMTAIIVSAIVLLCGLAYVLKLALFGG